MGFPISVERDNNMHKKNTHYGSSVVLHFSLVELLIVISIIAILASLLLPALNKARGRAYAIKCLSSYNQYGKASIQYSTDNNDWLTPRNNTGIAGGYNEASHIWLNGEITESGLGKKLGMLPPYLGIHSIAPLSGGRKEKGEITLHPFVCPTAAGYKRSYLESQSSPNINVYGAGLNSFLETGIKLSRARFPSRSMYCAEIGLPGEQGGVALARSDYPASDGNTMVFNHDRRCSVTFIDGHAELMSFNKVPFSSLHGTTRTGYYRKSFWYVTDKPGNISNDQW